MQLDSPLDAGSLSGLVEGLTDIRIDHAIPVAEDEWATPMVGVMAAQNLSKSVVDRDTPGFVVLGGVGTGSVSYASQAHVVGLVT